MNIFGTTKYLVFSSVGDSNCIHHWLADQSSRSFDLITYYYGDDPDFDANSDLLVNRKGLKYENFYHCLGHYDLTRYEAIWVVDDDIVMHTNAITTMFQRFSQFNLFLAQPSFCSKSSISWPITRQNADCILRYTNFVENGVAIFSKDVMKLFAPTFREAKTGWGLDIIWPVLLGFPTKKIAIIDEVCCLHPESSSSSLDKVIPRALHQPMGIELLKRYGLVPRELEGTAHPDEVLRAFPFQAQEFSRIEREP